MPPVVRMFFFVAFCSPTIRRRSCVKLFAQRKTSMSRCDNTVALAHTAPLLGVSVTCHRLGNILFLTVRAKMAIETGFINCTMEL